MAADVSTEAAYSDGSICRVFRVAHCGQTVQDRPKVCIEVKEKYWVDISIGSIFEPLGPP